MLRSLAPGLLAICLLTAGITSSVHAQQADSAYLELVSQGLAEFDEGRFPEARALFERAHAIEPNARTQRGIGMCAFSMRDYVTAIVALEASLEETRRPLEPSQRAQVEEMLARARVFVATMRIESNPADVSIEVDGHPPVIRNGVVLLNPGRHEVHVTSREHDATTRVVEASTNSEFELRVELVRRRPAPSEQPTPSPAPWIVVAGGGAGILTGAVVLGFGARSLRQVSDATDGTRWDEVADDEARAPKLTGAGIALLCVGVAGVGAGLTWALLRDDGDETPANTTVTVGLGSIALERRF